MTNPPTKRVPKWVETAYDVHPDDPYALTEEEKPPRDVCVGYETPGGGGNGNGGGDGMPSAPGQPSTPDFVVPDWDPMASK